MIGWAITDVLFSLLIIAAVAVVFSLERQGHVPDWDENFQWWHLAVLAVVVWAFWHVYFGTPLWTTLWTTLIGCAILVLFLGFVTGFKPGNYLFYVDLVEALKRSPRAGGYYEILILSIRTRFLNIELSRMLRAQIVHGTLRKFESLRRLRRSSRKRSSGFVIRIPRLTSISSSEKSAKVKHDWISLSGSQGGRLG